MITRNLLRLLAVSLLSLPGARAFAQHPSQSDQILYRTMGLDLLAQSDSDASARQAIRQEHTKAAAKADPLSAVNFDRNHDGRLDDAELAAWLSAIRQASVKSPSFMKRFDLNHDGKLDDVEWGKALKVLFDQR